jgi:hypothetical protein
VKKLKNKCGLSSATKKISPGCPISDRCAIGMHFASSQISAKIDFFTSPCPRQSPRKGPDVKRPELRSFSFDLRLLVREHVDQEKYRRSCDPMTQWPNDVQFAKHIDSSNRLAI